MVFDQVPPFWTGGPDPSGYYNFPAKRGATKRGSHPISRSQYPVTTGTSCFGIKYRDGVVIAADTMGSYGSLARFPDLQRVIRVNDTTCVAYGGDVADFQYLQNVIERRQTEEDIWEGAGGVNMRPEALHCWLTRVLYNRRSKFDPLWNTVLVGGMQKGKPFLGCVDMIGTAWQEDIIATGLGGNLAIPAITEELEAAGGIEKLTKENAIELAKKAIQVFYLRDCRATLRYYLAVMDKDGTQVDGPIKVESNWEIAKEIKGYD